MKTNKPQNSEGMVLLYALLVASVVLVIALTLSNIIVKQLIISATSRDMNNAYYAANAGRECISFIYEAQNLALDDADFSGTASVGCKAVGPDLAVTTSGPDGISIGEEWADLGGVPSIDSATQDLEFPYFDSTNEDNPRFACVQFDLPEDIDENGGEIADAKDAKNGNFDFFYARGYNTGCDDDRPRRLERVLCQDFDIGDNAPNSCRSER